MTYKEAPIRLLPDFSTETFQARREWHEIFKVMKSKDLQPSVRNRPAWFQRLSHPPMVKAESELGP